MTYYDRELARLDGLIASGAKAWCDTCQIMSPIVDQHDEGHMEKRGEIAYLVTDLECGHNRIGVDHVVGPAPGQPSADSVPNARPSTLAAARAITDPWADL